MTKQEQSSENKICSKIPNRLFDKLINGTMLCTDPQPALNSTQQPFRQPSLPLLAFQEIYLLLAADSILIIFLTFD